MSASKELIQLDELQRSITTRFAAGILNMSTVSLRDLTKRGIVPQTAGKYVLADVVHAYIRHIKDENRRARAASSSAPITRVRDAKAQLIELRIAKETRELIPQDEAEAVLEELAGFVRAEISSIPARVTRDLEQRQKLEREIDGVLERITERLEKQAEALSEGSIAPETESEDDA